MGEEDPIGDLSELALGDGLDALLFRLVLFDLFSLFDLFLRGLGEARGARRDLLVLVRVFFGLHIGRLMFSGREGDAQADLHKARIRGPKRMARRLKDMRVANVRAEPPLLFDAELKAKACFEPEAHERAGKDRVPAARKPEVA